MDFNEAPNTKKCIRLKVKGIGFHIIEPLIQNSLFQAPWQFATIKDRPPNARKI